MLVAQNNNPFDFMGGPKAPPVEVMGGPIDKREKAFNLALAQKGLTAPQEFKGTDVILDKKKQLEKFKFYYPAFPFLKGTYI